jgi:hypothetical protein
MNSLLPTMPTPSSVTGRLAAFILVVFGFALAPVCHALHRPVVVYALDFDARSARNVDLEFFDGGYFAGPVLNGVGTFIFTIDNGPGERFYTIASSASRIFTTLSNDGEHSVIASADVFETGSSPYMFTGKKDHTMRIPGFSCQVARTLQGSCLAGVNEFDSADSAGVIDVRATYQNGFTLRSNRPGGNGVLDAVALLTTTLESYGFLNMDSTESPGGDKTISAMGELAGPGGGTRGIARTGIIGIFSETNGDPGTNDERFLYSLWLKALRSQNREDSRPKLP